MRLQTFNHWLFLLQQHHTSRYAGTMQSKAPQATYRIRMQRSISGQALT